MNIINTKHTTPLTEVQFNSLRKLLSSRNIRGVIEDINSTEFANAYWDSIYKSQQDELEKKGFTKNDVISFVRELGSLSYVANMHGSQRWSFIHETPVSANVIEEYTKEGIDSAIASLEYEFDSGDQYYLEDMREYEWGDIEFFTHCHIDLPMNLVFASEETSEKAKV